MFTPETKVSVDASCCAGVTVEEGAVVRDSIIMPNSVIKKGAVVDYAIIAENTVIGEGAVIGERPEEVENRDEWGVAVVGAGRNISKNAKIGAKAMIDKDI